MAKGRLILRMEDSRSVVGWIGGQEVLTGRILSLDEVIAQIEGITTEDIQKVAQRLLIGDLLRLAVVGSRREGPGPLAREGSDRRRFGAVG